MIIGFDLDGVLCEKQNIYKPKSWRYMNGEERRQYQARRAQHIRTAKPSVINAPLFKECIDPVIITGRKLKDKPGTEEWVNRYTDKEPTIYYLEGEKTRQNMIKHKAATINKLGVEVYYEDDIKIIRGLYRLCPDTRFILVG